MLSQLSETTRVALRLLPIVSALMIGFSVGGWPGILWTLAGMAAMVASLVIDLGLMFLQALGQWLVGDVTLAAFMQQLPELLAGLGIMALRAGVAEAAPAKKK